MLLSDDFARLLLGSPVSETFSFDGRSEDYEGLFAKSEGACLFVTSDGYRICVQDGSDAPAVVLEHDGEAVGFYADMMVWVDPEHRGKGLAAKMILSASVHFGEAMMDRTNCDWIGFSPAGYAAHQSAVRLARTDFGLNLNGVLSDPKICLDEDQEKEMSFEL